MNYTIEKKYLDLVGATIKKETPKHINFRCLICGDSKTDKYKARAFVLKNEGDEYATCYCHNCGGSWTFANMLGELDTSLKSAYLNEIRKGKLFSFKAKKDDPFKSELRQEMKIPSVTKKIDLNLEDLPKLVQVGDEKHLVKDLDDEARDYLLNERKLSEDDLKYFKSIPAISAFVSIHEIYGKMYGYQIRWIYQKRFFNFNVEGNPKIWNLDLLTKIDKGEKIYVFEGIIDALSVGLENTVAVLGSEISIDELKRFFKDYKLIFCFDNDDTGLQKAIKYSKLGYEVLVHDKKFPVKDFNAALQKGASKAQLAKYIKENVLSPKLANFRLRLS